MKISKFFMFGLMFLALFAFACSSDDDNTVEDDPTPDEPTEMIVGKWRSPVPAPILEQFVDSIHAEFKANQTYVVKSFFNGAPTELTGTYVTEDGVDDIRKIKLEQAEPTSLTSEGIYMIQGNVMTYEVAQTEPVQDGVTPPSPEDGFGSTSGGAFGDMNVQTYYKMD